MRGKPRPLTRAVAKPYIGGMTRTPALALILALAALPLHAQTEGQAADDGFSLIEEGAKIILRSMIDEMKPALDEAQEGMGKALEAWEPAIRDLMARIEDITAYEPPIVLPNGDILIRRKRDPFGPPMPNFGPDGEVEL
ncbi:MAG: hypothetical protein RLZZ528_1482 [Pseudomonadota bacterium]